MAFVRLPGPTICSPPRASTRCDARWRRSPISSIATAAELDVCWLETQAEANSVRWTLIVRGTDARPSATANGCCPRAATDRRRLAAPVADRRQPRRRVRGRHGPSRAVHVHRHGRHHQPRRPADGTGRTGPDPRRRATGRRVCAGGSRRRARAVPGQGEATAGTCLPRSAPCRRDPSTTDAASDADRVVGRHHELTLLLDAIEAGGVDRGRRRGGGRQEPALARGAHAPRIASGTWCGPSSTRPIAPYLPFGGSSDFSSASTRDAARSRGRPKRLVAQRCPQLAAWLPLIADVVGGGRRSHRGGRRPRSRVPR